MLARLAERAGVTRNRSYTSASGPRRACSWSSTASSRRARTWPGRRPRERGGEPARGGTDHRRLVHRLHRRGEHGVAGGGGGLSGSTELEALRQEADVAFSARCRTALEPFAADGAVSYASLYAILGAAEGLTRAIVLEKISFDQARRALAAMVRSAV